MPGTKLLIKKTKKNKDNKSISFYKLNRRNNFFLNEIWLIVNLKNRYMIKKLKALIKKKK